MKTNKGKAGIAVSLLQLSAVGLSLALGASAQAQNAVPVPPLSAAETTPTPVAPRETFHEGVERRERELTGTTTRQTLESSPQLLPSLLGLEPRQTARLDSLYSDYARRRGDQEAKIARWQDELRFAQAPATFNEGKANERLRSIRGAQDDITKSFLHARGEAFKTLNPFQRARLQELSALAGASPSPARAGQNDVYRQLLLMPAQELLTTPIDIETGRRLLTQRANRSYYPSVGGYGSYGGLSVFGDFGHRRSGFGFGLGGLFGGHGRGHSGGYRH